MYRSGSVGGSVYPLPIQKTSPAAAGGDFAATLARRLGETAATGTPVAGQGESISLGRLSAARPTVSHLLLANPQLKRDTWSIIHDPANRGKNFADMPGGVEVCYNPRTREISWGEPPAVASSSPVEKTAVMPPPPVPSQVTPALLPQAADNFATSFDATVLPELLQPLIGTSYAKLDCYELVVEGLKKLGVSYHGRDGLQADLIRRARAENRPMNAYLTGEGLIEASGQAVYEKRVSPGRDPRATAETVFAELEGRLQPGQILSFSTARRGHTGVISRQGDTWAFLNSGRSDNALTPTGRRQGVAEEDLKAEIASWLRRAARAGDTLQITVGELNRSKLVAYMK